MDEPCDPRLISPFRRTSTVAAVLTVLLGCGVLAGWLFNIPTLKSVFPGFVTMKANTAIAFVLCGVSLLLLGEERGGERVHRVAFGCAGLVAMIGLLTFGEYLFGVSPGIDELLFKDIESALRSSLPGRMGLNTSVGFMFLGSALLLHARSRWVPVAHGLALGVAVAAFLALVGYAYGSEPLYGVGKYTRMGVHTALALLAVCVSVLSARPSQGVAAILTNRYAGGALSRLAVPVVCVVPPLIGWLILKSERAGLYDFPMATTLVAVLSSVVFLALTLNAARSFSRSDWQSTRTERALRARLEERVAAEEAARAEAERLQGVEAAGRTVLSEAVVDYLGFVRQVAQGNLARRLSVRHEGALGELGDDLNQMVESLEKSFQAEKEALAEAGRLQEEVIRAKDEALAELSTPLIPISDGIVAMPLIGAIDPKRASGVLETLLGGVSSRRARVAILDITGVPVVDSQIANSLVVAAQAVRLLGAEVVLTGIHPDVALTLVHLGADLSGIVTRSSLQSGIAYAMRRGGGAAERGALGSSAGALRRGEVGGGWTRGR